MKILKNNSRKNRIIRELRIINYKLFNEVRLTQKSSMWRNGQLREDLKALSGENLKLIAENLQMKEYKGKYETLLKEVDINDDLIRVARRRRKSK